MTTLNGQAIILCSRCGCPCPESLTDGVDTVAGMLAYHKAVAAGWRRVELEDYATRWSARIVRMYCPACAVRPCGPSLGRGAGAGERGEGGRP